MNNDSSLTLDHVKLQSLACSYSCDRESPKTSGFGTIALLSQVDQRVLLQNHCTATLEHAQNMLLKDITFGRPKDERKPHSSVSQLCNVLDNLENVKMHLATLEVKSYMSLWLML